MVWNPKTLLLLPMESKKGIKRLLSKPLQKMGEVAGEAISIAVTLMDGLVVIGGGIMGSHDLLMPSILKTLRGKSAPWQVTN